MNRIDPKEFGLHARTVLEQVDEHTVALVMDRKSRIIMADGRKIVEKAAKIQKIRPKITVVLKTSAPVCSKTVIFLQKGGITIHSF
jgi:hypothetical protein